MSTFDYRFTVDAPLTAVSQFHKDTRILKKLSPPPIFVQIHRFEPLANGSKAEFTLWFGPVPLRWLVIHSNVSINGFTDTQAKGSLKAWRHTHRFTAVSPQQTEVHEHIEYSHHAGWRGVLSRLLFSQPGLYGLFTARKLLIRWHVRQLPIVKSKIGNRQSTAGVTLGGLRVVDGVLRMNRAKLFGHVPGAGRKVLSW